MGIKDKGQSRQETSSSELARHRVFHYVEATVVVILLAFLQHSTNELMDDKPRYTLMLIGTCFATWRGGRGPGIFALILSVVVADWALTEPSFTFVVPDFVDSISLAIYFVVGLFVVLIGEAHRRERKAVMAREAELKVANEELAHTKEALAQALTQRAEELSELKRFVAEEDILPPQR